ncbi:MAG: hypothetical protein HZA24_11905 [Nitrospirae bacterium]|nr:hypothetical protein [Nitrospirota bacterium]
MHRNAPIPHAGTRLAVLLAALLACAAVAPGAARAQEQPERLVTAFLDHQQPGFVLLDEERELLLGAVDTLTRLGTMPARRRAVLQALQGLENGNAAPAAEALLAMQAEGELATPGVARQVAVVVGLGDIERVHAAFRRAMNEDAGNPDNWFLLGHALTRAGKDDLAVLAFNQVQLLSDLSGEPVFGARAGVRLGQVHLRQGNLREAEAQLADAAQVLAGGPHAAEAATAYDALAALHVRRAQEMLEQASRIYQGRDDFPHANTARRRHDALADVFAEPPR